MNERQQFFNELAEFWISVSCNGPKIIAGDLNSRLYCRLANEQSFIGNSIIEQIERKLDMSMNRFQLIELCSELELQIHNTFSNMELHDLVTYREICYRTEQCISRSNHELLDLFLVPQACAWQCQMLPSIKKFALKSHYYLICMDVTFEMEVQNQSRGKIKNSLEVLKNIETCNQFISLVEHNIEEALQDETVCKDIDKFHSVWKEAFDSAAHEIIPSSKVEPKRPWISQRTLRYIQERNVAKYGNDVDQLRRLNKMINHSVKQDRMSWMVDVLQNGDWQAIQKFRKSKQIRFTKLRSINGEIVDSSKRAEGLADHLEHIQWKIRPDTIPNLDAPIFNFAHMNLNNFAEDELMEVLQYTKLRKSSGDDGIPPEFWRICLKSSVLFEWLLQFCNLVWQNEKILDKCYRCQVACLFKKGDLACLNNYRPISLLEIGYKIFSTLILNRLQ